ncbi:16929_t:CDS:2, partial [Rhizophagus irregularis]
PTMIFSADVFHSGRGDNRPSIAAVCASLDSKATKYGRFILLRKILFYRDGVGETQFLHVKTYEVKALKEVFAS